MCTIDLWQFVFPNLNNIDPIHIDITPAKSFQEINQIILSHITTPSIIVGFSLGGFSAMNFATHYPEKVKKLIVVAANTNGLNEKEIQLRNSTIDFLEKHTYKGISQTRIHQFLHPSNHQHIEITNVIRKMDADLGKEILIRQLKATSKRVDITTTVLQLQTPILFIAAENDVLVKYSEIKLIAKSSKKGMFINFKNCGHMIPLEKGKELSVIINQSLT
ncbi:alpha/beta hydrolase [uncultured Tenacibaculum sp.]|uniref:alpha/beta hydrolase n=1 Tax=uncultured Tenacibaculum sp. TaxID=174713 RepID=UPI00260596C8|nr:alpha/beta hydrolase [uncultured Tenacibaculum sp.]